MNILLQMLYLFQCLPVKVPCKQFLERDRLIASILWQGKRARIKCKTLQLTKVKGGMGHPCLQEYYHVAQLRTYNAAWKDIEGTMIKGIPITALLSDNKLQEQEIPEDSIIGSFLRCWQEIVKVYRLGNVSKIMKWCAYDSDFAPNIIDGRFKIWISKGLTTYYSFVHKRFFRLLKIYGRIMDWGKRIFFFFFF